MSKIVFDDHTNLLRENYYEYDVQDCLLYTSPSPRD